MTRSLPLLILIVCCTILCGQPAAAQDMPPRPAPALPLRVAVKDLPPFVMIADDEMRTLSGFSIDLWQAIAERMNVSTSFVVLDTVAGVVNAVETRTADVGIAGITITSDRDARVDFSVPMFNAGLDILSRQDAGLTLGDFLQILFSSQVTQIVLVMAAVIFIAGNAVWVIERLRKDKTPGAYRRGIFGGLGWAALAVTTVGYADQPPRRAIGRVIALLALFVGIALLAQFTTTITSGVTLASLRGVIDDPRDLYGRAVGTVSGTTTETYLREIGIPPLTFPDFEAAASALLLEQVDVVVYDAPVLEFFVNREGRGRAQTTGQPFALEYYGIAIPQGSELRERIDTALLEMYEDGTYEALYIRWFGGG